jgi:hypothetical protein
MATERKEIKQPKPLPAPNSDFYEFAETLPTEELAIVKKGRACMETKVAPIINKDWVEPMGSEGKPLPDFSSKLHNIGEIKMHPLRKLRESGKATPAQVSELLAENIVFKSPILVRPIEGREVIAAIFAQSSSTRGSGTYTAEFKLDERTTFLRWEGTMDGHKIESFEVIVDNEQGLIVERTIALRPYPAVKLFRDAMYASLKDKLPPDVWDYSTP